jgi:hypothetical protein
MSFTENVVQLLDGELAVDVQSIKDQCYLNPDDIVIVGGTLVEGIGNRYSDIDVYVITRELREGAAVDLSRHHRVISTNREIIRSSTDCRRVLLIHTLIPGSHVKIDVEFKTFDELTALFARVRQIYEYACENLILLTMQLSERERLFINRMFKCIAIQNEDAFSTLLAGISRAQACYLEYRWVASDFRFILDLMGAWNRGEIDRAVDIARENVFLQTAGLLHLTGLIKVGRKWLPYYFQECKHVHDDLKKQFTDLFYLRSTETLEGKQRYVETSLDFVDDIFAASRPLLEANPAFPSGAEALRRLGRDGAAYVGNTGQTYAEMEFAYRARAYGIQGQPTKTLLGRYAAGAPLAQRPAKTGTDDRFSHHHKVSETWENIA